MTRTLQTLMLVSILTLSSMVFADEEKNIFTVTPENCGEMTFEKCREAMAWAKQHIQKTRAETQVYEDDIARMHEEALGILGEDKNKSE